VNPHRRWLLALGLCLLGGWLLWRRVRPPLPGTAPAAAPVFNEAGGVRFIERLTGGADVSDPLPLIVVIHGRGSRPEDIGQILASFGGRARVILPYGPEAIGFGFSWWPDVADDAAYARNMQIAADRLAVMTSEIARRRPTVGKPIVTGFSQGGMLSFALAALHPEEVGASFPAAGRLPRQLWPAAWAPDRAKPRIHAFHGGDDRRVPVAEARATADHLRSLGLEVELTEFPGVEHVLTPEMTRAMVHAIEGAIGGS
jgi:phospholipase/carboxylesterase